MPAPWSHEFGSHGPPARTAFSSASSSLRMSQISSSLRFRLSDGAARAGSAGADVSDVLDAFAEATNLCNIVKKYGAVGEWAMAAEKFADYWTGAGTWREMSPDRRLAFSEALKPNLFEWDAVMDDTTPIEEWAALLPRTTLLAFDPAGVSPTREIAAILRRSCPDWTFATVWGAGHMAPIMRPDLINPLVCSFLESTAQNRELVGV